MGEPKRSNVELLGEMHKLDLARLKLAIRDDQLHWEFYPSNWEGGKHSSDVGIDIHLSDRPLIELLSEVQQLLVDLRPDDGDQRDIVNGVLYRVAAELGDRLYAILFRHPEVMQKLQEALDKRNSGTHFLRIELEFSGRSAFMAGWPWEYLHRPGVQRDKPESGDFLALSANLVLNRVLNFEFGKGFSTRSPSVLFVVSRPSDRGPVDCGDIYTLVTKLKQDGVITLHDELIEPEWKELVANREPVVSWEAFSSSVKDNNPHVIHFIGHGQVVYKPETRKNVGQLAFVGKEGGKAEWHDEEEVAALLTSTSLRLVFLQACESGKTDPRAEASGVARSIALRKVPAVVAMQAKVKNDVASKFACTLYNNLAAGLPIDWAVMKGREAVNELEKVPERKLSFGVPIVYLSCYLGLIDPNADANAQGGRSEIKTTTGEGEFTCPNCGSKLKRKSAYCVECRVQLGCLNKEGKLNPCTYPLDSPSVKGTCCGDCGQVVPPLASLRESAPVAPDSDGLSSEPTLLRDKLKEKYPGPGPGSGSPAVEGSVLGVEQR